MRRVVILQPRCELYRVAFYELLMTRLAKSGVSLELIHGDSNRYEAIRTGHVSKAVEVPNRYFYIGKQFLVWQPALMRLRGVELVIIQQNSANLINYPVLLLRQVGALRVAFWGHGRNLQAGDRRPIREAFKSWYSKRVDHWFAYTQLTRAVLENVGFPGNKLTVVNNAIDSKPLIAQYDQITAADDSRLRGTLGIPEDARVGLYCGRLYPDKRLPFLMEAATEVRRRNRRFHFIVIGEGESELQMADYARQNADWLHFVGPKYGLERVPYFHISACQLSPGAVGLAIVDSFAMLTPLITTVLPTHGPEIAYLDNGVNGVIAANSLQAYTDAVIRYLGEGERETALRVGCARAREIYTIENMAERFSAGVLQAINSPRN
jgi:glycosyltransferase involved in cell wall biosynthesis